MTTPPPWSPEEDELLRRCWPDPLVTMPEIGRRVGRSLGAVKARGHKALKLGPKAIDRGANNVRHGYPEEKRQAVIRLRLDGLSIAEIQAELDVGRSFVTKNLRKQGIKKPRMHGKRPPVLDAAPWLSERPARPAKPKPALRLVEPAVVQLRPITPAIIARAKQQLARGLSIEDFADLFDVSLEGISRALKEQVAA